MSVTKWFGFRKPQPLEIPAGWEVKQLRDMATFAGGGRLGLTMSDYIATGYDAYTAEGCNGKVAQAEFEGPAVIVSSIGSQCGKSFLATGKFTTLANIQVVFPDRAQIDEYFLWLLLNDQDFWVRGQTGQPFIRPSDIKKAWIPRPPEPEQKTLRTIFQTLDSSVSATQMSIAKAERLQKGLMQQLLTGRLKPDGTLRANSEFKPDDHFGRLPRDWQSAHVKDMITRCEYGLSRAMSERGQYPILRMNNIERGRIVAAPLAYVDLSPEDFASYHVRKGDILFNRTNTVELVGKVGIFALEGDFVFASYLVRLVVNTENDPRFLNYYLNSFEGQKRIATKVTPSIGQANVNTRSLKSVWAIKPLLDEQSAIADRLDALFDLITAKEQKIAVLQRLKKSLMQNLLTGRISLSVESTEKKEATA